MDIRKILKESVFGAPAAYQHLDSLQVGILKKIASGNFDPDAVSQKVQVALDDLVAFGLVSDYDYSLTPEGQKALGYANKLGGSVDRRNAVAAKERPAPTEPFEID